MINYKKNISFKSIFYFCSLPLRLDSYRGCSFGCLYCFSQSLNNRNGNFNKKVYPANPLKLSNILNQVLNRGKNDGLVRSCISKKIPFHFGCVSDPLQPIELEYGVSYEHLKTLRQFEYPYYLCTKSDLVVKPKYLELFDENISAIQISFSTLNSELARKLEPTAPNPKIRISVLDKLSSKGLYTVARIQPFLFPRENLNEDYFKIFSEVGVNHIVLEHLRIPTNSKMMGRNKLTNALGIDMLNEYRRLGIKHSRVNYELTSQAKLGNVLLAKQLAHKYRMSFGSGDNDFHHISDSLCCCGSPHFKNGSIYESHFGKGAFEGIRKGNISFEYIDKNWHPCGSIKEQLNSDCRIPGKNTVASLLKDKLNKPNSSNSPTSFYGIEYRNNKYIANKTLLDL
jgi:DNA repair photolyase